MEKGKRKIKQLRKPAGKTAGRMAGKPKEKGERRWKEKEQKRGDEKIHRKSTVLLMIFQQGYLQVGVKSRWRI